MALLVYQLAQVPDQLDVNSKLPEPHYALIAGFYLLCSLGVIASVWSFRKREPSTWYKWLGVVLTGLLVLLMLFLSIFVRMVDAGLG